MRVIDGIEAEARTLATDGRESDGTLEWQDTTIVLVRVHAGDETGIGYTYADASAAALVESKLAPAPVGSRSRSGATQRTTWSACEWRARARPTQSSWSTPTVPTRRRPRRCAGPRRSRTAAWAGWRSR